MKRAIAVYVDQVGYLIHQTLALYESMQFSQTAATTLVCFGPRPALDQLPDAPDLVKCPQAPHALANQYAYINSIACFSGTGHEVLNDFDFVLKTDVDTFLTPAWNSFAPTQFTCGVGKYVHSDAVRVKLKQLAQKFNVRHRGQHNLGSTLYGTPLQIKQVCDKATVITDYLLTQEFARDHGKWPEWFRGVSSMYATEVAINHFFPDFGGVSTELDYPSHQTESIMAAPHLHCWHTQEDYSKHKWIDGHYKDRTEDGLNMKLIPDFCLAMALRARNRKRI